MGVMFNGHEMRCNIKESDLGISLYKLANGQR